MGGAVSFVASYILVLSVVIKCLSKKNLFQPSQPFPTDNDRSYIQGTFTLSVLWFSLTHVLLANMRGVEFRIYIVASHQPHINMLASVLAIAADIIASSQHRATLELCLRPTRKHIHSSLPLSSHSICIKHPNLQMIHDVNKLISSSGFWSQTDKQLHSLQCFVVVFLFFFLKVFSQVTRSTRQKKWVELCSRKLYDPNNQLLQSF